MITSYYLIQTEPTLFYGQAKVAHTKGSKVSFLPPYRCPRPKWVGAGGIRSDEPDFTRPATVDDLKTLVASGKYRLVDEYGEEHDVQEVFG